MQNLKLEDALAPFMGANQIACARVEIDCQRILAGQFNDYSLINDCLEVSFDWVADIQQDIYLRPGNSFKLDKPRIESVSRDKEGAIVTVVIAGERNNHLIVSIEMADIILAMKTQNVYGEKT